MIPEADARQAIALAGQGVNVSQIARRLGHDRKTVRIYLNGHRAPGQPRPHADSYAPFAAYVLQRAADDRHLRGAGLHREITALGYAGSYSAFTRELRGHGITAACRTCKPWQPVMPAREQRTAVLPARVAPVAGETISSYLARTAAANHLPLSAITDVLPPWFAARAAACDDIAKPGLLQPGDARCLAALTGITENALRHALPALAGHRDDVRPPLRSAVACRRCAARHGQHDPVPVHLPAHQRACERHRTWLGRAIQIDVTTAPDIIAAAALSHRLASEHGVTRLVLAETTTRQETSDEPAARRRAAALALASPGLDPGHPDTAEAAAYPETIKMAAALLSAPGAMPAGPE
jgi:TniQ